MKKIITAVILFSPILIVSCYYDKAEPKPTCASISAKWTQDVAPVIQTKCAVSGCHNGSTYIGDFSTYNGLKPFIDNGQFELRVFNLKVMPPSSATPLSVDEYNQLKCWYDSGYPEN